VSAPGRAARFARERAGELIYAAIFLTRVPLPWPGDGPPPADLFVRSLAWFPAVGGLIGAAGGGVLVGGLALGLPAGLAALLAVALQVWLTGALHEDGLADLADGLGGGRTRDDKLAIMRDSRLGSYGALALGIGLAARVVALAAIAAADPAAAVGALAAAGAASRAVPALVARLLAPARTDGLAARQGRPPGNIAALSLTAGALVALAAAGPAAGAIALAAGAAAGAVPARLAARQVGGYTGDVLGACQQSVEIAMLVTLAALA
jgi:adenosylcobinamide-GDP ribazoletransferase